jgi:hypothetical protein
MRKKKNRESASLRKGRKKTETEHIHDESGEYFTHSSDGKEIER